MASSWLPGATSSAVSVGSHGLFRGGSPRLAVEMHFLPSEPPGRGVEAQALAPWAL